MQISRRFRFSASNCCSAVDPIRYNKIFINYETEAQAEAKIKPTEAGRPGRKSANEYRQRLHGPDTPARINIVVICVRGIKVLKVFAEIKGDKSRNFSIENFIQI